jgi:hypothetical protein
MKNKGVTGKILTTIISLIVALFALAILWLFLTKGSQLLVDMVYKIIETIKCKLLCHGILSNLLDMCARC